MNYLEKLEQTKEFYEERLALVMERLEEIANATSFTEELNGYFRMVAKYLLLQENIRSTYGMPQAKKLSLEEGAKLNEQLYSAFSKANYNESYANPTYAVSKLGKEQGQLLSAVFYKIICNNPAIFIGDMESLCIYAELLVELYNLLEDEETSNQMLHDAVASFMHDYSEVFTEQKLYKAFVPTMEPRRSLVMESELTDFSYLYRYGQYVSEDELLSAKYLMTLSEEEIASMASTFTEGYRIGFEVTGKDLSIKSFGSIHYPVGFERVIRKAVENFGKLKLSAVLTPMSTSVNKQMDYDHKEDAALWMDKSYVEHYLECAHNCFEDIKDTAMLYAGPAVTETFGEEPFAPQAKDANVKFSDKQQELSVYLQGQFAQMQNRYIHGDERSFTIIAYPVPSIGDKYEEIFKETVKINTLDYALYQQMQQKIIDVLDTADRVHIKGANGNRTDLYVNIVDLRDPQKETAFENCAADVNIPVGEVFTSPQLTGTNGILHVSQVYLKGLKFVDLEICFEDGRMKEYTCGNFESEEENKKFIEENLMYHHKTLPMGEFAIGTNTTAYRMGKTYDIAEKLPILIAEKTGPHFAVGDTCYSYDEDNMTYNPDGKAIVARENEISALRKEDPAKAYFHCHTDITIPFEELESISVVRRDMSTQDIIRNGRFVVPGTEELNKPLEEDN